MDRGIEYHSFSPEETIKLGIELGASAAKDTIFCLFGGLGAGKTTLIKGIVEGATGSDPGIVSSPTFVYLNIYEAREVTVYHFDLYRLKDAGEFLQAGFEEYLFAPGLKCIEWSERIHSLLPENCIELHLQSLNEVKRVIKYAKSTL